MELQTKTLDELREIAKGLNIKVHHRAKEQSIIKQIKAQQPHRIDAVVGKIAEPKAVPSPNNTPEQIEDVIKSFKKEGFISKYDDNSWYFEYRGRADSGHLSVPLRVIRNKAEQVSRGRIAVRTMGRDAGDQTYAGNILTT